MGEHAPNEIAIVPLPHLSWTQVGREERRQARHGALVKQAGVFLHHSRREMSLAEVIEGQERCLLELSADAAGLFICLLGR